MEVPGVTDAEPWAAPTLPGPKVAEVDLKHCAASFS